VQKSISIDKRSKYVYQANMYNYYNNPEINDSRVKISDHIQYNIKHIYIALMPPSIVKL